MAKSMGRQRATRAQQVSCYARAVLMCGALSCLWAFASVSPSSAQTDSPAATEAEARDSFARGRAAYDAGDFDVAAEAFEKAYALSGKSGLLYNLYLAFRDANRQEKAAAALRSYLEKDTQVPNRPQLEARLKALEAGIRERQRAAAEEARLGALAPPVVPVAPAAAMDATAVDEPARWWIGPVAVMGGGGVLMLASVIPGVLALHKASDLKSACVDDVCDDSLRDVDKQRKTLAITSDVLLFGGVATAAAGAVWFFVKRSSRHEQPPVTASCTRYGCAAAFRTRF